MNFSNKRMTNAQTAGMRILVCAFDAYKPQRKFFWHLGPHKYWLKILCSIFLAISLSTIQPVLDILSEENDEKIVVMERILRHCQKGVSVCRRIITAFKMAAVSALSWNTIQIGARMKGWGKCIGLLVCQALISVGKAWTYFISIKWDTHINIHV